MKTFNLKRSFLLFALISLVACSGGESFYQFHSIDNAEWNKNAACKFEVQVTDTIAKHDVLIEVRSNNKYEFRNLWLFVEIATPDGKSRRDTLNCELADSFGEWYGKGFSLHTLSMKYEDGIQYPRSGIYTYTIRQGMRADDLKGISDIGLKIVKSSN